MAVTLQDWATFTANTLLDSNKLIIIKEVKLHNSIYCFQSVCSLLGAWLKQQAHKKLHHFGVMAKHRTET
jgi:hypothetical protein